MGNPKYDDDDDDLLLAVILWYICGISNISKNIFVLVVEILSLLLVAVLWGVTNPLLKKGTEGIEHVKEGSRIAQFLAEVKFLFLNIRVNTFGNHQ